MRPVRACVLCLCLIGAGAGGARAQEPPPRIGPIAVDLHGVVAKFGDDPQLAASRGLGRAELPGPGFGASAAVSLYLPKVVGVTVGLGAHAVVARSATSPDALLSLRPVTETFKAVSPQVSLNFGSGNGWSYLSVGVGRAVWSIVPEGGTPLPADEAVLDTIDYGGGARWFAKKHLAFSLDVRVYEIPAGQPVLDLPGSPRTRLLVIGAGVSLKP